MKILIICHYYPPLHSIASLRPYAFAKYWSDKGHDVSVLTTVKSNQASLIAAQNVAVEELEYFGSKFISDTKSSIATSTSNTGWRKNLTIQALLKVLLTKFRGRYGIFAAERMPEIIFPWFFSGKRFINDHIGEFDLVLSEYSPPTALLLGLYAKRLSPQKTKLVLDYRDSWTVSNYSQPGFPIIRFLERLIENRLIRYADLISCTQAGIAKEFYKRGCINVAVIENGYFDDIPEAESAPFDSGLNLVYTGSYGGYRSIDFLYEALRIIEIRNSDLYAKINIFILGNGTSRHSHPKIHLLGKVDYPLSLAYQKNATILFLIESSSRIAKYNIPGKFFEYFRYKKPIIAFGPKDSFEIARYLKKHEIGEVSDASPAHAAEAIMSMLDNISLYPGKDLESFTRKSKALDLLGRINGLFA
jgi:hypothetical protein